MKSVILAGGLGTRVRPFTQVIPKPLLPIGEKAVLEIQIEHLEKYGFDEIFLATNYKSEYIESFLGDGTKYGVTLTVSKEDKPLGTAGPLSLLKDRMTEPFLLMNGDILSLMDLGMFYRFAVEKDALLTVAIKEIITPFQFGNIYYEGDYVTGIDEKPDIRTKILAGIYIMKPDIIELIPNNEYYGMDTLMMRMLEEKIPIVKYETHEYWLDIGNIDNYEEVQNIYEQLFKNGEKT
ncbi:MAG TPA: sugar phosphate nucleotidyltransferase [Patescibacteria group bacterium]|nr:sugar phosphate nucleotidyltransferase [Patescibacteria group bacterium]